MTEESDKKLAISIENLLNTIEKLNDRTEAQHSELSEEMKACYKSIINLDKRLSLREQAISHEFEKINKLDQEQNRLLDEHIAGVNTLKKMLVLQKKELKAIISILENQTSERFEKIDDRIDDVEAPQKAAKIFVKFVGGIGILVSSIFGVLKLFGIV